MAPNLDAITKEMAEAAIDIGEVRVEALNGGPYTDAHMFFARLPMEVSKTAAISLCSNWARLLRQSLPESHDEWSSYISVRSPLGSTLGVYCIGWAGREDEWHEDDELRLPEWMEWQGLYHRLDKYLQKLGTSDWQGNGDHFLFDEWSGNPEQSFTIYRIEFLTPDILKGVQEILANEYAHWRVMVVLDLLPPIAGIESEAVIDIHADRIVENWDRALMVELLGERLKV